METFAKQCAEIIKNSNNIVAFTGAGISTNSGIPDFRGPNGIYVTKRYDPLETFDINYFYKDPKPFFNFTRDLLSIVKNAKPSFAHMFLKKLEDMGKLKAVITQNIDMLHQKAGNKNVYELHGSYRTSQCVGCGRLYNYDEIETKVFKEEVPKCDVCGSLLKPDIVFFGEQVKFVNQALFSITSSDLLLVIGTSLKIYPASMMPYYAKKIIAVNKDELFLPKEKLLLMVTDDIDEFFVKVDSLL